MFWIFLYIFKEYTDSIYYLGQQHTNSMQPDSKIHNIACQLTHNHAFRKENYKGNEDV